MGIKHAGQSWDVKLTDDAIGDPEEGQRAILGMTDEGFNTIIIDGTMPLERQEEVFLHELIHIADPTVPEFAVKSIGANLYGILVENGLLVDGFLAGAVNGSTTAAEAKLVGNANDRHLEGPEFVLGRDVTAQARGTRPVSDKPWAATRADFTPEQWADSCLVYSADIQDLPVREPGGTINRNACHLAAARLAGGMGGDTRAAARGLLYLYEFDLKEAPPESLKRLAR